MKSIAISVAIAAVVLPLADVVALAQAGQSTAAGVFTRAQAKRGNEQYVQSCSACHLEDMSGSHTAPALADDSFIRQYDGRTVGDLFERIKTTMPQGAAGSLSDQAYADIVAAILQANQFKSGAEELPANTSQLKQIVVKAPAE